MRATTSSRRSSAARGASGANALLGASALMPVFRKLVITACFAGGEIAADRGLPYVGRRRTGNVGLAARRAPVDPRDPDRSAWYSDSPRRSGGTADALRSGRSEHSLVWVQIPPSAPQLALVAQRIERSPAEAEAASSSLAQRAMRASEGRPIMGGLSCCSLVRPVARRPPPCWKREARGSSSLLEASRLWLTA